MKVVFFGSSPFGIPSLEALAERHTIAAIVTQPDRPAGRGGKLRETPVGQWASRHASDVEVLKPERVSEESIVSRIRGYRADAWVVIAYGQKLPRTLLDGVFAINLHASLLPRWRGAAPIHAAILAGDTQTGNSVIALADRMDAGEVYSTSTRAIGNDQTTGDLHDLLADDGAPLILETLRAFESDQLVPIVQDESLVTLAPKLGADDGIVDFDRSADDCRLRINGMSPKPGARALHDGEMLKLLRARTAAGSGQAGVILDAERGLVACGVGAIQIVEVQPAGKRAMDWGSFARGRGIQAGDRLRSEGDA